MQDPSPENGALVTRAFVEFGLNPDLVEEREVDQAGYAAALAEDPVHIASRLAAKAVEVKAVRDSKIAAGIPFAFPDGAGTIQTRDLIDARNIQTNVTTALILSLQGETRPVMTFRDMENVEHAMTPAQMLAMGAYVAQQGQIIYSQSWSIERTMAELTSEQLLSFDVAANWPE